MALVAVAAWYAFALAIVMPLTDASVADSWLYGSSVRRFMRTGEIRFAGYTQAMPIVQVLYGGAWARWFGASPASLELSMVVLAIACGAMFHALVRRCGAGRWQSLVATGLLICNPCFAFLSFSFMTEVPFLLLMIAAYVAFARAEGPRERWWMWLAAAAIVAGFMVRPFAGLTIVGCAGAIAIYDARIFDRHHRFDRARIFALLLPFGAAFAACTAIWIRLTVFGPKPWFLQNNEQHFRWLFMVPIAYYVRAGLLGPMLYLGAVLSPLALMQLLTARWRRVAVAGVAIFAAALVLRSLDHQDPVTPEFSCFGGWTNALLLRGAPNRFFWNDGWQYAFLALGSAGAAGLTYAARDVALKLPRAAAAAVIAALVYWAATIPLWFFNDRYYLLLVPAGALVLALAPTPQFEVRWTRLVPAAAFAMTLVMGLMSLGGARAYQRGLAAILAASNALERTGVSRSSIDAGYSLNGEDLYRYPKHGIDTMKLEAGIPMITSPSVSEYTIAGGLIDGTRIVRTLEWPGPFGFGHREFYLVKKIDAAAPPKESAATMPPQPGR